MWATRRVVHAFKPGGKAFPPRVGAQRSSEAGSALRGAEFGVFWPPRGSWTVHAQRGPCQDLRGGLVGCYSPATFAGFSWGLNSNPSRKRKPRDRQVTGFSGTGND